LKDEKSFGWGEKTGLPLMAYFVTPDRDSIRFCIIGGDGVLGSALVHDLRRSGVDVICSTRKKPIDAQRAFYLDLADPRLPSLPKIDVVILAAAVSRPADCRSDPGNTWRINVEAQASIGEQALARGAFVIFPSSTLVFDGSRALPNPEDPRSPCTEYGKQKAAAESALLRHGDGVAVVRLGKVISRHSSLFENWRRDLLQGQPVYAFDDLVMAPIAIGKTVAGIETLGRKRASGIWHLCGREDISYFEAAEHLACRLKARASLVRRASAAEAGIPVEERPPHSALAIGGSEEVAGVKIADPRAEIDEGLELISAFEPTT
jgi:dTDP-4-dehydrorhamnose reductase